MSAYISVPPYYLYTFMSLSKSWEDNYQLLTVPPTKLNKSVDETENYIIS